MVPHQRMILWRMKGNEVFIVARSGKPLSDEDLITGTADGIALSSSSEMGSRADLFSCC